MAANRRLGGHFVAVPDRTMMDADRVMVGGLADTCLCVDDMMREHQRIIAGVDIG